MDMYGIALKDIMIGYLCRISLGYLRISQDIYLKYPFKDMSKKDILNLQRYPEIYIFTYLEIS